MCDNQVALHAEVLVSQGPVYWTWVSRLTSACVTVLSIFTTSAVVSGATGTFAIAVTLIGPTGGGKQCRRELTHRWDTRPPCHSTRRGRTSGPGCTARRRYLPPPSAPPLTVHAEHDVPGQQVYPARAHPLPDGHSVDVGLRQPPSVARPNSSSGLYDLSTVVARRSASLAEKGVEDAEADAASARHSSGTLII